MVKIKIAPGHDREVLSAVVDAVHPVQISADANGAYLELEDLEWLDELSLAFVEQPFSAAHTPAQLGERAAGLNTPVALDESIGSLEDMVRLAEVGAASLVSIKPLRLGGIESSVEIGRAARAAGLEVFVGGMLETGIGRAGALAVASALRGPFPTDLGPSGSYFDVDICEPIETDAAGRISAPQGVGLGRTPSPDLLERFTTEEIHLRR
ncbi:MAG TPA: enolase C-terminal domain-like protein, partial [Microthrixaceae bacterium]|nr:enolase C-terminal domain-like protein [Microthrixaceae bacterium]